ncbi:hypothetical protein [Pinibacter soli]|uniref:Uncharacterized protein n=1 Tax=Pinibacter soli TaxID=3044211 RepID=A0ABT6RHH1_9BACT|nr:hypothetical protein [Pinibacter soli]MDI3321988.1 hypothetical protein [Pinibacter soli]
MTFLDVNFETLETTLQSFDRIADKISKDIYLKINNSFYRLTDFEFYTYSKALPDPHTYRNKLQLKSGKLYLHSSGLDITFGDGTNYGGILLRAVVKLFEGSEDADGFMKEQFDGPQRVATEFFSNLNSLFSPERNDISIFDINDCKQNFSLCPAEKLIQTKRVGLTPKPTDIEDYYRNLPLRYITILPKFPNFKQVVKGIESMLKELEDKGKMERDQTKRILGYKRNFQ